MELFTILNFIILIYVIVTVNSLKQQIERQSGNIQPADLPSKRTEPVNNTGIERTERVVAERVMPSGDDPFARFVVWFGRDWPLKVGACFILLGFVWLVTYAFLNNWIGPVGRIVIGLIAGSAILMWGSLRIRKNMYQGEILAALGAGVTLVSIFSAQYFYHAMFPPAVALMLVTAVTAALAYTSYKNRTVRLAALGLIVGGVAPLLIGAPSDSILGLFSYLLCLVVGTVWLVRITGWRVLTILSIIIIWLYSIPSLSLYISPSNLLYMRFFAVTFTVLFYGLSLAAFIVDRTSKPEDSYTGLLIGLYSFHWIFTIIPVEWQSMVCVFFAVSFMIGSLAIFRIHRIVQPTYLYTAVSIGFLIAATMKQFHGPILPAVLATEAFALTVYADRVFGKKFLRMMCVLYILPVILSLELFFDFQYTGTHQLALLYIGASLYGGACYLMRYARNQDKELYSFGKALLIAGGIYSLVYVWVAMPFYMGYRVNDPLSYASVELVARVMTLILYAAVGMGLYFYGSSRHMTRTRQFGFSLLIFVIARLFIFELWSMALGARIVTFFAIGAIFITSVVMRKSRHET